MRLIDADALLNKIRCFRFTVSGHRSGKKVIFDCLTKTLQAVCDAIESAPTVKEPVEKGQWINPDRFGWGGYNIFKCSKCQYILWGKKTNFCPNCGKPMDKELE